MWPFKKKQPKKEINSLYKKGDFVRFTYKSRDTKGMELYYGYIWEIYEDEEGRVLYDIQVGSQCPWFAEKIPEEKCKPHVIKYAGYSSDKKTE